MIFYERKKFISRISTMVPIVFVISFFIVLIPVSGQNQETRRDSTVLEQDRIPGYQFEDSSGEKKTKKDSTPLKSNPILTKTRGFSSNGSFVELRGGGSIWIGGPVINGLDRNIRTFGFDTNYTYTFGNQLQQAYLFHATQNYPGASISGIGMGLLYEKSISNQWSLGGGIDYREYSFDNIPNNILSRSLIVGNQRFLLSPTQEEIERNINLELIGIATRSNNLTGNRILFLEVNASYHFLPENAWDPYLRPIFGIGYDSSTRSYALKLGGGAGIRYYFENGIYLGGELTTDTIYLVQSRVVKYQARDQIHELTYNAFIGKKFD